MKKLVAVFMAFALALTLQAPSAKAVGFVQASDFAQWQLESVGSVGATSATVTVRGGVQMSTSKGVVFNPISTTTPLSIEAAGGTAETVTPSSVSCPTSLSPGTCTFTATFSYAHNAGFKITSGDLGVDEAKRSSSVGDYVLFNREEDIEITSSVASKAGTTSWLAVGEVLMGMFARVTTAIVGPSTWQLGISGTATKWGTGLALTAGTTVGAEAWAAATRMPDPMGVTAQTVLITCPTTNCTAGKVHITASLASPVKPR